MFKPSLLWGLGWACVLEDERTSPSHCGDLNHQDEEGGGNSGGSGGGGHGGGEGGPPAPAPAGGVPLGVGELVGVGKLVEELEG